MAKTLPTELKLVLTDWGHCQVQVDDEAKTFAETSDKRASIQTPNGLVFIRTERTTDGWEVVLEVPERLAVKVQEFER